MSRYSFTVSLNPNIQVNVTEDGYTLSNSPSEEEVQPFASMLTLPATRGMGDALAHLREGNATSDSLVQTLVKRESTAAGEHFAITLQQLDQRGWLNYAVLPLAVAIPMVETAKLNLTAPHWTQVKVSLSRFAYQHSHEGAMVLESPLSPFRMKLLDWRASALLAQLPQPQSLAKLTPPPYVGPETAYQFLNLLWAAGFLTVDAESASLQLWDFHNLLFHSRSRQGRHDYPTGDIQHCIDQWSDFPVVKRPMSDKIVPLPRPNLEVVAQRDATLTAAIEARASIREYDEAHPITIEQLSELLYRTARVKEIYTPEEINADVLKAQLGSDFEWGELSRRPYPCGGAMYELEVYPVVRRCQGLASGLYHYDPLNHQLAQLDAPDDEIAALITDAHLSSGEQGVPQVLLVITARFGRLFRKYRSLAYALVLKHVGVLYQNFYLVATNMGLAPCSLGAGDSDCFAQATGLDYIEESSVGEFMLGSLPNQNVVENEVHVESATEAETESVDAERAKSGVAASEVEAELDPVGFPALTQSTEVAGIEAVEISVSVTESDSVATQPVGFPVSIQPTEITAVTPSAPTAPDNKLADRIPGFADLQAQTLGDDRITIVVLDGNADFERSCFQGANVSKVFPYWHEPATPIANEDYTAYLEIQHSDLKGDAKAEKMKTAFPDEALWQRIAGDFHATGIISVMVGQPGSPVPGIAPRCRVINIPLNTSKDKEEFISALNLARAFELALDLGANVIHCAACRPTQTGLGEELFAQAVKKCQDQNILIVAPAGNNKGDCWCMPAALPGVLAVGMLKDDGKPANYSNWGGNYEIDGIMAPGENILAAQPKTEKTDLQQGTSLSAPVMTGIIALLMSLQLQQGKPIDAEAIRAALLNTAIPCDPEIVEEPERCLRGCVNLPGAMGLLFDQPSVTISFSGDQVTRTERTGYAIPSLFQPTVANTAIPAIVPATPAFPPSLNSEFGISPPDGLTGQNLESAAAPSASSADSTITPSTAHSGLVYALGTLSYDFGDEARRDTFKQRMDPIERDGVMIPADPYDARQMVEYLDRNPGEARSLIWLLNLEQDPIYVLEPKGPFASDIYEMFLLMLAGQLDPETSSAFVERISVSARRTNRTVELFSEEVVPVVTMPHVRGMHGWNVGALIDAAFTTISVAAEEEEVLQQYLTSFLNRVYNDLHNVGQTSRDRALNFATTNIYQAVSVFAEAIADGRQLDTIEVEKSPFCRLNSDCWDVKLTFFDPENSRRARKIFLFTIDVADLLPVTLGRIKSWCIQNR